MSMENMYNYNIKYIVIGEYRLNTIDKVEKRLAKKAASAAIKTYASNGHALVEREENDFYATHPSALEKFLDSFEENLHERIWEPSCGMGHLSEVLKARGYKVCSSDLINRGYGYHGIDFLKTNKQWDGDIVTNPPYSLALDFVKHSFDVVTDGKFIIMFLKITFLEGIERKKFYVSGFNPKYVYVSSSRLNCSRNADFEKYKTQSAVCYAWYVWQKSFNGDTKIRWFN